MKKENQDKLKLPLEKSRKYWKIMYEDQVTIIKMVSEWLTKTDISKMLWVSRNTFYEYLKKNPYLETRIKAAKVREKYETVKAINKQIKDWDGRLWLDKAKVLYQEYKPKQEIQNNTTVVNILTDIRALNKDKPVAETVESTEIMPAIESSPEDAKMH